MLSIDSVARVVVTLSSAPATPHLFDVGLVLAALPSGTSFTEDLRAVAYETLDQGSFICPLWASLPGTRRIRPSSVISEPPRRPPA